MREQARIQVTKMETVTVMAIMAILPEALMVLPLRMIRVIILNGATLLIV
jgi:hypothetical protein